MSTNNPWLTPYQRSFDSIKAKLKTSLNKNVPEITDFSEGNIFIIIISIFSAIAEVLHYYIDNMARETFFYTARRYSSLYKHAKLVDYHIKAASPASTDIYINTLDGSPISGFENGGVKWSASDNITFTDSSQNNWVLARDVFWENGTYTLILPLVQKEKANGGNWVTVGQLTDPNQNIYIGDIDSNQKYVEGSMVLEIQYNNQNEPWTLVDTFAYSGLNDKVYKVELDSQLRPYIVFGDGKYGKKPNLNGTLRAKYWITIGSDGNVPENSFTTLPEQITSKVPNAQISFAKAAGGGTDYEDFDMIKNHLPLSVKSLGVAVTKDDYESVIRNVPGVDKAYVNYICGKLIEAYITPYGNSEASSDLIGNVTLAINEAKVISVDVEVKSTKEATIFIDAEVWGNKSYKYNDIYNSINQVLIDTYSRANAYPNKPIRLSDIYSLIDNLSVVDYLKINSLVVISKPVSEGDNGDIITIPYIKILSVSANIDKEYLNYTIKITDVVGIATVYSVTNTDTGDLVSIDTGGNTIEFGKVYTFTDKSSIYGLEVKFEMSVQRLNENIKSGSATISFSQNVNKLVEVLPQNYNLPVFKSSSITLNIHEQV